MSLKPTEPIRDEHENVNGSPEERIGDDTNNEGEESDEYEELDDKVCCSGELLPTKIWEFNSRLTGSSRRRRRRRGRRR